MAMASVSSFCCSSAASSSVNFNPLRMHVPRAATGGRLPVRVCLRVAASPRAYGPDVSRPVRASLATPRDPADAEYVPETTRVHDDAEQAKLVEARTLAPHGAGVTEARCSASSTDDMAMEEGNTYKPVGEAQDDHVPAIRGVLGLGLGLGCNKADMDTAREPVVATLGSRIDTTTLLFKIGNLLVLGKFVKDILNLSVVPPFMRPMAWTCLRIIVVSGFAVLLSAGVMAMYVGAMVILKA